MRNGIKITVFVLIAFLLASFLAGIVLLRAYHKAAFDGYGEPTTSVEFTIEEGETVTEIAASLLDAGIINNDFFFKIFVNQHELSGKLQAGSFSIPNNLSFEELAEILQHAVFPDIWVTVPVGLMATDTADIISAAFATNPDASFSEDDFLLYVSREKTVDMGDIPIPDEVTLEGYLYPDTYQFPPEATAEYVVTSIIDNLDTQVYEPHLEEITSSSFSFHEILTLASILERETRHAADRPIVADILIRRLENGWALEVDATLLYYFEDWTYELSYDDLQVDTPYNTRKYQGFPPTPISNPGLETVTAVLHPQANNYWYFISDSDGILHYASTLEEHNQNIRTYLQ